MKNFVLAVLCFLGNSLFAQSVQLHYDMRHWVDPKHNSKNFPTVYIEYFKNLDSGHGLVKPGSILLKMEADMMGENGNIGKGYMQVAQTLRLWRPKVFLHLSYSGGLGVTEPKQYSYYITNTIQVGAQYTFQWHGAWLSSVLDYKYVPYSKPTNDFIYTLYWWRGYYNYKVEFSGDFSLWTENKNHGDDYTKTMTGKRFSFFAEPQLWYNISKSFAAGTRVTMYYHVNTWDNVLQAYPTVAVKYKL
ncbi:MAG TPA: DUF5020 family protein [Chitinophagaceae bacterium]|nr:DUF5020 family protein [Chitinophagaceae bacterium]